MVKSPFLSMVNLVAGRKIAAELIQEEMTAEALERETLCLLENDGARAKMRAELDEVAAKLRSGHDPIERAAEVIETILAEEGARWG